MSLRRAFSLCSCLVALQTALAQGTSPAEAEQPRIASTTQGPKITWESVYVEGPYVAMTFDDGPSATLTPKLLDLLAALLRGQEELGLPDVPWAVVAAIFVRVGKRAVEGETPAAAELEALAAQL